MNQPYKRRKFIKQGVKAGLVLPIAAGSLFSCQSSEKAENKAPVKKLSILILGGTSFLGPHQIAYALGRGHSITTFTRGKTRPTVHKNLFADVEYLIGDRKDNLTALENRKWDVVVDNSGHDVEWTKRSAELLKDNVDLYVYTSSTGVYYPYLGKDFKEDHEVLLVEPETVEDEDMKIEYWYGVMKSNSEIAAKNIFGADRTLVVRPTYMIGPGDKSDRFIHWPIRLQQGGEIMIPGKANDPIQYADVRDVAEWMIRLIENKSTGTFNAVGPKSAQNMYDFIAEASEAFKTNPTFIKIDDYEFLKAQDVLHLVPWIMPVGNNIGSALANNQKAIANGLTFRPLKKTVKDIYDWWISSVLTNDRRFKFELDEKNVFIREKAILDSWKQLKS